MTKNSDAHLLNARYQALLIAYHCMERDETLGRAEVIGYWKVIGSYLQRVERDKKPSMRDLCGLAHFIGHYGATAIKYETLGLLASGWIG